MKSNKVKNCDMVNQFVAFRVAACSTAENRDGPQSSSVYPCGAGDAGLCPGSVCLVFSIQKTRQQEHSLR